MTNPSYFDLLPDLYKKSGGVLQGTPFSAKYLKIFEAVFSGLEPNPLSDSRGIGRLLDAEVVGNLFYPRFSFLFEDNDEFMPSLFKDQPPSSPNQTGPVEPIELFFQYLGVAAYQMGQTNDTGPSGNNGGKTTHQPAGFAAFPAWLEELLQWLAGWMALELDPNWTPQKKRLVIARSMPAFRIRGTVKGLETILATWLEDDLTALWKKGNLAASFPNQGYLSVTDTLQVVDGTETWPVWNQYGQYPTIEGLEVGFIKLQDRFNPEGTYLTGHPTQTAAAVLGGQRPWTFFINLYLPTYNNYPITIPSRANPKPKPYDPELLQAIIGTIKRLVDYGKPEGTTYRINILPTWQLRVIAGLGVDTLLGSVPGYKTHLVWSDG